MYGRPGARACSGSHLRFSKICLYSVVRTPGALRTPGVRFSSPLPARNRLAIHVCRLASRLQSQSTGFATRLRITPRRDIVLQFAIRCPRNLVECQIITNDQESRLLRAIESRMRTACEGGLSHVFASRAAVPRPPTHFADAMPLHASRCHIASRRQLCLADSTAIFRSCFTAVIIDNCGNAVRSARHSSAIHLHEQSLLQGHAGHICCRGGRERCLPPTMNALTGASDGNCQKR